MERVEANNPITLDAVMRTLAIFRKCRCRVIGKHAATFTIEDLVNDVESAWDFKRKIPHALSGSIAIQAVKQGLIRHIGYGRAERDTGHHREVRKYSWDASGIDVGKPLPMERFINV